MSEERIKLTKSEAVLYDSWANDYRNMMAQFAALINDNMSMRIADLGREHGINLNTDEWDFDHKNKEFVRAVVAEVVKDEPTPLIPGKETVNSEG